MVWITGNEAVVISGRAISAADLARTRQQLATAGALLPSWDELDEHERREAILVAAGWLQAVRMLLAPPVLEIRPGTSTCCEPEDEDHPGPGRTAKWGVWRKPACAGDSPVAADRDVVAYAGERFALRNRRADECVVHRCSPNDVWRQVNYQQLPLANADGDRGHAELLHDLQQRIDTHDGLRRIIEAG